MYCSRCGTALAEAAAFCGSCGTPTATSQFPTTDAVATSAAAPAVPAQIQPAQAPWPVAAQAPAIAPRVAYAGFWLRFVAVIIDGLIMRIVFGIPFLMLAGGTGIMSLVSRMGEGDVSPGEWVPAFMGLFGLFLMVSFVGQWLYFALMESSSWQATLGKKALGLAVTDMSGHRVTFARASGRYFGKIVSGLTLFIGFIMAGFTVRKQALHDLMAGTLVLRKL
jgi:uncharacterized RDD family membrane protein YckC